mgnify:CR=1 FL=1
MREDDREDQMQLIPIKTRILYPPKDNLYKALDESLPKLREGDVVCVTSKVLAIHQGRCVQMSSTTKQQLVEQEAYAYLPGSRLAQKHLVLSIKENILIPNAGIDDSKQSGYYILWPEDIEALLQRIWRRLRTRYRVKNLAVIATDTHSTPLRYGFSGIAIGMYGIEPIHSYKGKCDIFGNPIQTKANVVDPLAAMAVYAMGEGDEQTPVLIIRGLKGLQFATVPTYKKLLVPTELDIYAPLFKDFTPATGTVK